MVVLVVSVVLVGLSNMPSNKQQSDEQEPIDMKAEQPSYGQLGNYVQELEDEGFEVSLGTWEEPEYYSDIPDLKNFISWAELARGQHRQRGEDDPLIYVDIERSVFWFIGRIALFSYDDVTFYWFV